MAKRSVIKSPPSLSEEESSSVEKHRPKKRKLESTSRTPTKTVEESGEETEEDSSDEEESSENNEVEHTKSKFVSQSSSVECYSSGESKSLEDSDREKKSNNSKKNGKGKKNFSSEDEEILLNSILRFRLEKGKEVNRPNSRSFCEFLKGKLSFTNKPTLSQVSGKILKMKRKYFGSRAARHTSEHDLKMKEIAGQIWNSDVEDKYPMRRSSYKLLEKEVGKKKISVLKKKPKGDTVRKAVTLEEKLRKQKKVEMKQDLKKMDLMKETSKLILEGTEKSRNQV